MERDYKALANRYFEGKSTPEEEQALHEYVAQSPEGRASFRGWEREWATQPHFDVQTENAWQRFATWMGHAESRQGRSRLWRVGIAAAVVVLMACTALTTWYVAGHTPERYYTLTAPMGSKTSLRLPDGSLVWLNAGSTLSYSTHFSTTNRHVRLQGEGYFEVAHHDGAQFVVSTRGYDVVVTGTRFDISAYNDEQYITTTLMQGGVLIERGDDHLCMTPGDMVRLDTRTGQLTKTRFANDTRAWVQNMAEYGDITLEDLSRLLSRRYAVSIDITSARLRHMRFSISLRNKETIDDVLDALQRITAMKVCRDGKQITISE